MKKQYIPLRLALACCLSISGLCAQDRFSEEFETIRTELISWDPVRGEWLSNSLRAMSNNEPIPDRYFPEDFTPFEMLKAVPHNTRMRIMSTADSRLRSSRNTPLENRWMEVSTILNRPLCKSVMGRSFGDPHLSTFDGVNHSFQAVGEFILVKSASDNMEVHVRQKSVPTNPSVSVTTAIAMNVAGDRLCIYAQDVPEGNNTTPVRINGEAVYLENGTYYLEHGGTIRSHSSGKGIFNRRSYEIRWPGGETVKVDADSQMDVAAVIFPCSDRYQGILGNANNDRSDDFNPRGLSNSSGDVAAHDFGDASVPDEMQRQHLAFLSGEFAMSWRITESESLFDYGFNQSTHTFSDLNYPQVHRTVNDIPQNDRDRARRECERAGIAAGEMNGCIYDVGFARIPPSPRPVIADNTSGRVIRPVVKPAPNVNPGRRKPVEKPAEDKTREPITRPNAQTLDRNTSGKPVDPSTSNGKEVSAPKPSKPVGAAEAPVSKEVPKEQKKPAYEPPVEEEKPKRPFVNRGDASTPAPAVPARTTEPVRTPAPVKPNPAPAPVKPAPAPAKATPTPTPPPVKTAPATATPPAPTPAPVKKTPAPVKSGRG